MGQASRPLAHRVIKDARILAFQASGAPGIRGGLVLGDSEGDRLLRHTRRRIPFDSFDLAAPIRNHLSGHYAYGGMAHFYHFGHFMAEMVHRVLPSLSQDSRQTFIFVGKSDDPQASFERLPDHVKQVYSFLGLCPNRVQMITQNTLVDSLYVSQSGSDLGGGPVPAYLDMLDAHTERQLDQMFGSERRAKRIYVSRSKLGLYGAVCGERYVESALETDGYYIFHPQEHPVCVQMDHYRKADVVIFLEGSACHGAELFGRNAIKSCIMLARRGGGETWRFDPVLRPRAREYAVFRSNIYLGSMYRNRRAQELPAKGVSILQWDALVKFLRDAGVARLSAASKDEYIAAATADFVRYIEDPAPMRAISKCPDLKAQVIRSFESAKAMF